MKTKDIDDDLKNCQQISELFWKLVEDMLHQKQETKGDET